MNRIAVYSAVCGALCGCAHAQVSLQVAAQDADGNPGSRINLGSFPASAPITVSTDVLVSALLGAGVVVDANSVIDVWVYDMSTVGSGTSQTSIPGIFITGTVLPRALNLAVADVPDGGTSPVRVPDRLDAATLPGAAALGFVEVPNPALRQRTRLVVHVTDTIGLPPGSPSNGRIEAGQIYIMRVPGRIGEGQYVGGNITADLSVLMAPLSQASFPLPDQEIGIGNLFAGNSLSGTITVTAAPGDPFGEPSTRTNFANISRILVGSALNPSVAGISSPSITSEGLIHEVHSAGPIGTPASPTTISAGNYIHTIRAFRTNSPPDTLDLGASDFHLHIRSGTLPPLPGLITEGLPAHGSLCLLETAGNVSGSVIINELNTLAGYVVPSGANPGGLSFGTTTRLAFQWPDATGLMVPRDKRAGILIRGVLNAPVTIARRANTTDIMAESILQPVIIGHSLKGSVVAFGTPTPERPLAGTLHSVSVGRSPDDPEAPRVFTGVSVSAIGSGLQPIASINPALPLEQTWFHPDLPSDGGSVDAVIRGHSIGPITIAAMSSAVVLGSDPSKSRPRIEGRFIGDVQIDTMHAGALWSGALNYNPAGAVDNQRSDDFANLASLRIGCMGAGADVWYTETPLVLIDGDVTGQIRTPILTQHQTISIGGTLADASTVICGARNGELSLPGLEASPRDRQADADETEQNAPHGAIYIQQPLGLAGQIILEANNTTGAHDTSGLAGFVRVGGYLPDPGVHTLATSDSLAQGVTTESILPLYQLPSTDLGGGAVGVVPFAVHLADSTAVRGDLDAPPPFASSALLRSPGLPLRYYGPVVLTDPLPSGDIASRGIGTSVPFFPAVCGEQFTATAVARTLTLTAPLNSAICPLEYRALPETFGVKSRIPLATGFTTRRSLVGQAVFYRSGCGLSGNPNPADVTGIGGPPALPDGIVTGDDFNAFIAAFASADLFADIVGIGLLPNGQFPPPDGLVTGDDFNAFIAGFAADCDR